MGKFTTLPFSNSESVSSSLFDLVHSNIWGPTPIDSYSGFKYYVSFINDYSRFTWVYLLKHRSEIPTIYAAFTSMIKTQFNSRIKVFRSDCAKEYVSSTMCQILSSHGTLFQQSCPHTHEQNGVAERKHRHILDTT